MRAVAARQRPLPTCFPVNVEALVARPPICCWRWQTIRIRRRRYGAIDSLGGRLHLRPSTGREGMTTLLAALAGVLVTLVAGTAVLAYQRAVGGVQAAGDRHASRLGRRHRRVEQGAREDHEHSGSSAGDGTRHSQLCDPERCSIRLGRLDHSQQFSLPVLAERSVISSGRRRGSTGRSRHLDCAVSLHESVHRPAAGRRAGGHSRRHRQEGRSRSGPSECRIHAGRSGWRRLQRHAARVSCGHPALRRPPWHRPSSLSGRR